MRGSDSSLITIVFAEDKILTNAVLKDTSEEPAAVLSVSKKDVVKYLTIGHNLHKSKHLPMKTWTWRKMNFINDSLCWLQTPMISS